MLSEVKMLVRNSETYRVGSLVKGYFTWGRRQFSGPSPAYIKQACLVRNGYRDATWIETGTLFGQTTRVLSRNARMVYSIEPEPTLFANAKSYFRNSGNVEIINGTSEAVFPSLLPGIQGDVNFWLDGHYSAGVTFKGAQDTPILDELRHISAHLGHFRKLCVLIDDIRLFGSGQSGDSTYPPVDLIVDWARSVNLRWHIEQDIFIAKSRD